MGKFKDLFARIIDVADDKIDEIKHEVKKKLDLFDPIEILVYTQYASENKLYVFGRVLENKNIGKAENESSTWDNLVSSYKRINSNEVANANLQFIFQAEIFTTKSNEEGYFSFEITPKIALEYEEKPLSVEVTLLDAPIPFQAGTKGIGEIFLTPPSAEFGVISDIDDTIVVTDATSLLGMAKSTFLENAQTRIAFEGVADWYQALKKGKSGTNDNPFFYVSSSPWNLFDLLYDFLEINKIPNAPILLQDYGFDDKKMLVGTHGEHKLTAIRKILNTYPNLPFVLIGDSGQQDPVIYTQIFKEFPKRISAIYIRDAKVEKTAQTVRDLIAEVAKEGIEIVLFPHSKDAWADCQKKGLL